MYYVTFYKQANTTNQEYTLDMFYNNAPVPTEIYTEPKLFTARNNNLSTHTVNKVRSNINYQMLVGICSLPQIQQATFKQYNEYKIPKSSGGYRTINEPQHELKEIQTRLYDLLIALHTHPHDAVFSYTKGRTCKNALERHASSKTKWYYKFDIKDFFPSCTSTILYTKLRNIYPFCCFESDILNTLIDIATYNNCLPQGSPLSPLLSNMVLLPLDYYLSFSVKHFGGIYTRYADDILISFPDKHDINFIENIINNHLREHVSDHFKLNEAKSRCGSIAGANWNLGLIINKEHNITLGHKRKQILKSKINNFMFDFTNHKPWSIIETQSLQGELNYLKQIEPDYASFIVERLNKKYDTPLSYMCRSIITGETN